MTIGWNFSPYNYGRRQGISDSGVETFRGDRYRHLAKEICQNSLDAIKKEEETVKIDFQHIERNPPPEVRIFPWIMTFITVISCRYHAMQIIQRRLYQGTSTSGYLGCFSVMQMAFQFCTIKMWIRWSTGQTKRLIVGTYGVLLSGHWDRKICGYGKLCQNKYRGKITYTSIRLPISVGVFLCN